MPFTGIVSDQLHTREYRPLFSYLHYTSGSTKYVPDPLLTNVHALRSKRSGPSASGSSDFRAPDTLIRCSGHAYFQQTVLRRLNRSHGCSLTLMRSDFFDLVLWAIHKCFTSSKSLPSRLGFSDYSVGQHTVAVLVLSAPSNTLCPFDGAIFLS